jgi:hypothetical protein
MVNYIPTYPIIEAVGCLNSGIDTALYRRSPHFAA